MSMESVLSMAITNCKLSTRTSNLLERAGIRYVRQLVEYTEEDLLLSFGGQGKLSIKEIKTFLSLHGLELQHEEQDAPQSAKRDGRVGSDMTDELARSLMLKTVKIINKHFDCGVTEEPLLECFDHVAAINDIVERAISEKQGFRFERDLGE